MSNFWLDKLEPIVKRCLEDVPPLLTRESGREIVFVKPDGDPAIEAEIFCENLVKAELKKTNLPLTVYSEEQGYLMNHPDSKFIVLLDPIDGSFFALRKLPGGCIAISIHDASTMEPVAAIVGDYLTKDIYWASEGGAFLNGSPISTSGVTDIRQAFISTTYGKISRFSKMIEGSGIVEDAEWFETTGTMLSMVRVATGQIDAYFDFMLGYKSYDFAPGAYIAKMAGAIVTDEKGNDLHLPTQLDIRCKFVIASSKPLHEYIIKNYYK